MVISKSSQRANPLPPGRRARRTGFERKPLSHSILTRLLVLASADKPTQVVLSVTYTAFGLLG